MDALEYEKARIRMCRTMVLKEGGCVACPLYDGLRNRCWLAASAITNPDIDTIETHVDRVIKWAKDHPVKTRQSEFLRMFPDAIRDGTGLVSICPKKVCTTYQNAKYCVEKRCGICRQEFWLAEVTDDD